MTELRLTGADVEARGPAGAFVLSDAPVDDLGGGKRAAVRVRVGEREVPLRLAVMGGENLIGLSKANRAALGVDIGDIVDAVVRLDTEPRTVEVPPALAAALADEPELREIFEALAPTHRREYTSWVAEAKREDTRDRRVGKALEMLRATTTP